MVAFFYLNQHEIYKKVRANRAQFKKFARLNKLDKKSFFEFYVFGLKDVTHKYVKEIEATGGIMINF